MNILKKGSSTIAAALFLGAILASFTYVAIRHHRCTPGVVVMIMGTSSSGKTSIINELKKMYGSTYEIIDIDTFTRSYPIPEQLQSKELDIKTRAKLENDFDKKLVTDYYSLIKYKALKGHNILVDTVPTNESDTESDAISCLSKAIKLVKVLLYCPLDITIGRVEKRNLTGISAEHRETIQPISQYRLLYKPQSSKSEQVLDCFSSKDMKHLINSSISSFLKNLPPELKNYAAEITKQEEKEYKEFVQQFRLDTLEEVSIVPLQSYDLILDAKNTPKELADEIVSFLKQQKINLVSSVIELSQTQRSQFKKYVGKYKLRENFIITITEESGKLFAQATDQEKLEIFPESEIKFFYTILEAQITFIKDKTGKIIGLILRQNDKDIIAEKIE